MRYPGFLRTFGSRLGAGLADELLDRWFPPPPSFLQRFAGAFIDQAPVIVSMARYYLHNMPTHGARSKTGEPNIDDPSTWPVVRGTARDSLGEFTCPKCGGHTWGTLGQAHLPVVERHCTNGLETSYGPGMDPNTVKTPCMFRWFSTDDHKYFAKPSADDVKRATETQACVPTPIRNDDLSYLRSDLEALTMTVCNDEKSGENVVAAAKRLLEEAYEERALLRSVLGKRVRDDEPSVPVAARVVAEADAFIKKQSDKIADLMLDNVFPAGRGEIGFVLTHDVAKKIGVRYDDSAEPIRATLVLDGWRWMIRLGPGRVGGQLVPVEWALVEAILKNPVAPDQTAMAQNAAGGVA